MKKIAFILIFSISIFCCKKDVDLEKRNFKNLDLEILIPETTTPFKENGARKASKNNDVTPEIELMLEDISKNIAENLDQLGLRKLLFEEANKKYDGDFDILISSIYNDKSDIKKYLSYFDPNFNKRLFNYLINYPKLNISIPVNIEKWDYKSKLLLVTSLRNHEEDLLTAFGKNQLKFNLSHNLTPNLPVIVVNFNERIEILKEKNKNKNAKINNVPLGLGLQHTNSNTLYLTWLDVSGESSYEIYYSTGGNFSYFQSTSANTNYNVITGLTLGQKYYFIIRSIVNGVPSAWSQVIATTPSARADGQELKVTSMRFNDEADLRVVEKWLSGAPEMRLRVIVSPGGATSVSYTTPKLEPSTRAAITNNYWVYEVPLLSSWSSSNSVLRFNWREEDWNDNGTFSVNAGWEDKLGVTTGTAGTIKPGIGATISSDPGKDLIADTDVFFWDLENKIYQSTIFKFKLKE